MSASKSASAQSPKAATGSGEKDEPIPRAAHSPVIKYVKSTVVVLFFTF